MQHANVSRSVIQKIMLNKIYNEDCIKTMARMPDDYLDLTVTSPPYDNLRDYKGYSFNFEAIAKELFRVTKQGGVVVWVVGDQTKDGDESGTSFRQALYFKEIGFNLFDTMIYSKGCRGAVGSSIKGYWQDFEYMFVLSKGEPKTINLILDRQNRTIQTADRVSVKYRRKDGTQVRWNRKKYGKIGRRTNVWRYSTGLHQSTKDKVAYQHPAIFPEKLAADHIRSWSDEGELIYDPFMGSGTTAKMARYLKRRYVGSEISKEYCQIAKKRLSQEMLV